MILATLSTYKVMRMSRGGLSSLINVLLLRLVNNVMVNDGVSAEILWRGGVVAAVIGVYGGWLIKELL